MLDRVQMNVRYITIALLTFGTVAVANANAQIRIQVGETLTAPGGAGFLDVAITNTGVDPIEIAGFSFGLSVEPTSGMFFTSVEPESTALPYIFLNTGATTAAFPFSNDVFPNQSFTASDIALLTLSRKLTPGELLSLGTVGFSLEENVPSATRIPVTLSSSLGVTGVSDPVGNPVAFTTRNGAVNTPIPEPTSWAVWMALAALGWLGSRCSSH